MGLNTEDKGSNEAPGPIVDHKVGSTNGGPLSLLLPSITIGPSRLKSTRSKEEGSSGCDEKVK